MSFFPLLIARDQEEDRASPCRMTDEKRKELGKKVENGGDENIKTRTNQILPQAAQATAEGSHQCPVMGLAAFVCGAFTTAATASRGAADSRPTCPGEPA
jgi:hypothetical protein